MLKKDLWHEYTTILKHEETEARRYQQSRAKWLELGDRNTRFFHQTTLIKHRNNKIEALMDDSGVWVHEESAIQNLLVSYYQTLFASSGPRSSNLFTHHSYGHLSESDTGLLGNQVSYEEVRMALFSMANFKAPGPDGFHPLFKSKWDILDHSVVQFVKEVFSHPISISIVNQTLLTLNPKGVSPSKASDFHPIALCNVIYKIVTKVIANRIKCLLPKVISPNQNSFIAGRSTLDNSIILQEVIHSMNAMTGKKGMMIIKLDLEKAYDRMKWDLVEQSLNLLAFPPNLIVVIRACMNTVNMSINWCGRPTQNFSPSRGLRQGDPLYSYLFVIAMEKLSHLILDAVSAGSWKEETNENRERGTRDLPPYVC